MAYIISALLLRTADGYMKIVACFQRSSHAGRTPVSVACNQIEMEDLAGGTTNWSQILNSPISQQWLINDIFLKMMSPKMKFPNPTGIFASPGDQCVIDGVHCPVVSWGSLSY